MSAMQLCLLKRPLPGPPPPANAHTEKCRAHTFLPNHLGMWLRVHKDQGPVSEKGKRISDQQRYTGTIFKHELASFLFLHIVARRTASDLELHISESQNSCFITPFWPNKPCFYNTSPPCLFQVIFVH